MGDGYSHPTMARMLGDSLVQSPGWLTPPDAVLVFNSVASVQGSRGFFRGLGLQQASTALGVCPQSTPASPLTVALHLQQPQRLSWLQGQCPK